MNERAESDLGIGDPIFIRAAAASVTTCRGIVSLSGRERELMVAVAVQTQPASAIALGRLLYPDRDDEDAGNVVKVYAYRLRKRIAANFIVWRDGGYALGPGVQLDAAQARGFLDRLSLHPRPLEPGERETALALARDLRSDPPDALQRREWFETISRRLYRLGHELAMLVGRNALEFGSVREAIRIGKELTYEDPCDEEAWELLIRAQLDVGEHVAAMHGFRFYEATLAKELDVAPSTSIRRILENGLNLAGT